MKINFERGAGHMAEWKGGLKRGAVLLLTAVIVCASLDASGFSVLAEKDSMAEEAPSGAETEVSFTVPFPGDDLPDSDTLFTGYVEKVFYRDRNTGSSILGTMGARQLQGYDKELYDTLKEKIGQTAAGALEDTAFTVVLSEPLKWKTTDPEKEAAENKFGGAIDIENILACLRADCPYELYWFDKTAGVNVRFPYNADGQYYTVSQVDFSFAVSVGYQADGNPYKANRQQTAEVELAAENAWLIVEQYKDRPDYEKLRIYLEEICGLVSYDVTAETDETDAVGTACGASWQMVRVFDGKADTNAACEGYSMAFQYLCDMSEFADTTCCTVTGTMAGGKRRGAAYVEYRHNRRKELSGGHSQL